jgi:hypothetical protein
MLTLTNTTIRIETVCLCKVFGRKNDIETPVYWKEYLNFGTTLTKKYDKFPSADWLRENNALSIKLKIPLNCSMPWFY